MIRRLLIAMLLVLGPSLAAAAVDLEATRIFFDRDEGYPTDGQATVTLVYEVTGSAAPGRPRQLQDLYVDLRIGENRDVQRRFRITRIDVPQTPRNFRMTVDVAELGLEPGRYPLEVVLDPANDVPESNESNNLVISTLVLVRGGEAAPSEETAAGERLRPTSGSSSLLDTGASRSWKLPLEAGFHPGHGRTGTTLRFRSGPAPGSSESLWLILVARPTGDPFARLGPLDVVVTEETPPIARCRSRAPSRYKVRGLEEGRVRLDITRAVQLPDSTPRDEACLGDLVIELSFPPLSDTLTEQGSLLRLDGESAWLMRRSAP